MSYGTVLSSTQLNATAPIPGSFAYSPAAGTLLAAGSHTLSVNFTPQDEALYGPASAQVSLTVTAAKPVLGWTVPASVPMGTVLDATLLNATATASGVPVAGAFTYSPAAGTVMNTAGPQTLTVTFTPSDGVDYTSATASVTLTVTPAKSSTPYLWKNVQIVGGGFVTGIVMHPAQAGLMYARTDIGGAYRWDAAAQQWIPLTDWITRAQVNLIGIESIGLDPTHPQRLYLAAGTYAESWGQNGAMLVSADQGNTFSVVPMPIKMGSNDAGRYAGERLAVDPNDPSIVYFGSRLNGLWVSRDHGATWTQVASFPVTGPTSGVGVVFVDFAPGSSSAGNPTKTIYVGVSALGTAGEPASLYVSQDAGQTWAEVPGAPTGLYVSHGVFGPDGNLYLSYGDQVGPDSMSGGAIWRYTPPANANPGAWQNITPSRPAGYKGGWAAVAVDRQQPGVLMASTIDQYAPVADDLYRSVDGGQSWYSINTVGATRDVSVSPWLLFGQATAGAGNWIGSLQIDPFDSNHVVYGTGQTVWTTDNIKDSDHGGVSHWTVGAKGIEETVVAALIAPPAGPARLISGVYDIGGFTHTTLDASPASGMSSNPIFTNTTGLDFAQAAPLNVVRVGSQGARTGSNGTSTQFGAYSSDGGATWTPFASIPATKTGSGTIAISADAKTLVWAPADGPTSYSTDLAATWVASVGAPAQRAVVSDRVDAKTFYIYDASNGKLLLSADGGVSFRVTQSSVATAGVLSASVSGKGNLWLSAPDGLYRSTNGGAFGKLTAVSAAWAFAEGAPAPGSQQPAYYLAGQVGGVPGLFQSIDGGATWKRIDDAQHEYGVINVLAADPKVFGRIYLGTASRGIVYGDINP